MKVDLRRTFAALEVREYRLLALSQLVSIMGTIIQSVGQAWLVLRLDGGGVELGMVAAAQFLPLFLIGPIGGVVADRYDKRRLLLLCQSGLAATALLLATLTISGQITIVSLGILAGVGGTFGALDAPARAALVPELVGRARLANAVSLHEVWINLARIVGPILGGTTIATLGVGACFVANALSFLPSLVVVSSLAPRPPADPNPAGTRAHLLEGLRYAWHQRGVRWVLVLAAAIGTFFNFGIVLPLLARDTFGRGPQALGVMIAIIGAGAVAGSLALASGGPPSPRRLERLGLLTAALLVACGLAPTYWMELVLLAGAGGAGVCLVAVANSLLQLRCDVRIRGRLLALWTVAIVGSAVVSGPIVGAIAAVAGPRAAMVGIAVAVLIATVAPRQAFLTELTSIDPGGIPMPTLDRRTKRQSAVRPITPGQLVVDAPEHRDLAARAQTALRLPPLILEVDGVACTIDCGVIRHGGSGAGVRVVLDQAALTDLVAGVRAPSALLFHAGGAELPFGGHRTFDAWSHVLRALFDGVPLHERGAVRFLDQRGEPLSLHRTFAPDDDDGEIAHFLADAGFLHLRGWVDPSLLPAIEAEVAAAAAASAPDQAHRWWSRMNDGTDRCTRVMYLLDVSPTMAALVEGDPYTRLGRLFDDGHQRFPERAQSSEALVKPTGVQRGITDLPWHRDCAFGGHDYGCAGYAIGLPLGRTGPEAGHLRVVAGSHRASVPAPGAVPGYDADLPVVEVFTEPGDLTVHIGCILHGTVPPQSGERTVTYTTFSLPPLPGEAPRPTGGAMPDLDRVAAGTS